MRPTMLICALFLVAGCDRSATTEAPRGNVWLTVRDYRYDHQNVRARSGDITFAVINRSREETNFRVRRENRRHGGSAARGVAGSPDVGSIATLQPDEYGTTTVRLRPGVYTMYSSVGRHQTLGEYGTLTVTRR